MNQAFGSHPWRKSALLNPLHTFSRVPQKGHCWHTGKVKLSMAGWKGSRLEKYKGFGNSRKKSSQEIHSLVPSSTFSPEISKWCWSFRSICASPLTRLMSPRARRQPMGTVLCRVTQVASRGKSRVFYTSYALRRRLCGVICGFNCRGASGTVRRRRNCHARSAPKGRGSLGVVGVGGFCAKCVNKLSQRIKLVGDKWMWCIGKVPLWLFFKGT